MKRVSNFILFFCFIIATAFICAHRLSQRHILESGLDTARRNLNSNPAFLGGTFSFSSSDDASNEFVTKSQQAISGVKELIAQGKAPLELAQSVHSFERQQERLISSFTSPDTQQPQIINSNLQNVGGIPAIPSCIEFSEGALYSANLYTFPYGHVADEGQYAKCTANNNLTYCTLEPRLTCVNSNRTVKFEFPSPLTCAGAYNSNGMGVCYSNQQCTNQSVFQAQLDGYATSIADTARATIFAACYGLEAMYMTPTQIAEMLEYCSVEYSYISLKPWCNSKNPVPENVSNSDSTLAIKYTLLVVLCFSAFATLVGIFRRAYIGWREDFKNDDEVITVTLASQQGRRTQNRELSILDRLLYGEAELTTAVQDAKQMEEASLNANRGSKNDDDFYITQLSADDPERAFRRTIGSGESGQFETAYDSPGGYRNVDAESKSCCSCECDTDTCCRSFSSSVVTLFDSFDVLSGLKEFFTPMHTNLPTAFFDGIRTLAMGLVVAGHTLYFPLVNGNFGNKDQLKEFLQSYQSITLFPAFLAVDTFFWLSGFLSMYLILRQFDKMKKGKDTFFRHKVPAVILAYVNRYLRLTPTLMIVVAITNWVLPTLVEGPLSRVVTENTGNVACKPYFWAMATYYFGVDFEKYQCMAWFWYLSVDIVLFAFVPVVAAIDHTLRSKNFNLRYVMPVLAFLTTGFGYGWAIHQHPITAPFVEADGKTKVGYIRAVDRYTPFIIGSLTAMIVNNFPGVLDYFKDSKTACWVANIVALCMAVPIWNITWHMMVVFETDKPNFTEALNYGGNAAYFLWGIPLSLITLPALAGYKNFITRTLGHPFFTVVGKLTYGMYLVHPVVIEFVDGERYRFHDFQRFKYYVNIGGVIAMASFVSLILFLLFDRPIGKFCTWLNGFLGVKKQKRFS